ncbi:ZPR1 zinc finger domain-containing protein [Methanofollis aquaemaris]|uniref:ZPR1 zinc finger domain-containing protein n=1 Tax=Methanofollis aquaemaris TaxID=126734 RepID=A0A8A3S7E8_9EURY|nr:ZPR1 zinc finger domain-containing protein [Methanofollis aquaemaris]QSZ67604.1 ZPR1 zinc finger domain-containing protein [Methanofollis aquaemaris]
MRTVLRAPCPVCREEIEYVYQTEEVPYFSEILIESATCPCGWRMSDAFIMREGVPTRDELTVSGEEDLSVRVVRGSAGTIEVPEFGVEIKPGPAAESFISNVEGVLDRIDAVLEIALRGAEAEERERCLAIRARIAAVKRGEERVTLIIDDPTGNSALIRNPGDGCE